MAYYYTGSLDVQLERRVTVNADKSGTREFGLIRLTEADAIAKVDELNALGYNATYSPQNGFYLLNVNIGNPNTGSAAPEAEWSVTPELTEKSIVESALPFVTSLSTATKERVQFALKNPGKNLVPSLVTTELTNAKKLLTIMQWGIETIPYFTLTVARSVSVPRNYITAWSFDPIYTADDKRNIYSKAAFISTFAVPAYVSALLPESATVDLGNSINGYWGYFEKGRNLRSAPGNQWVIEQTWAYDRWITDLCTIIES